MTSVTIYHNPRCSKSRASLALIELETSDINIVNYLEHPPSASDLRDITGMLNCSAMDIVRQSEEAFGSSGLTENSTEADVYAAIASAPILLQRPIVVCRGQARIGRPPEAILEIIR